MSHEYRHVRAAFFDQPLALLPSKAREIAELLEAKGRGEQVAPFERRTHHLAGVGGTRRADGVTVAGRVAVLPIFGVLAQRVGMMEKASGGISTEEIGASLDSLVRDQAVKSIVLLWDSPGGAVSGLPELASRVRAARDQKKVVSLASPMAASAAFWIAAQASELFVEPAGMVGSVGVICAHEDVSEQMAKEGVKATVIASSPYKGERSPYAPLSAEARAELQANVDYYHSLFVADLAKGRGVSKAKVESDYGKGRMKIDKEAVAAGMADGIVTLSQLVTRLGGSGGGTSGGGGMGATAARVDAMKAQARRRAAEVIEDARR